MIQSVKVIYRLGAWWRDSGEEKMWNEQRLRCLHTSSSSISITSNPPQVLPARAGRSFAFLSMQSLDSRSSSSWQWGSFANILWFTQIASEISIFFQASAFWTNSGGIAKQSVGTPRRESSSSFCVGLHAPPLLLCLRGFRPTSAHVNLDKYRALDCSVSSLRSLSFYISPWGGWKLGSLGNSLSFPSADESSSCSLPLLVNSFWSRAR